MVRSVGGFSSTSLRTTSRRFTISIGCYLRAPMYTHKHNKYRNVKSVFRWSQGIKTSTRHGHNDAFTSNIPLRFTVCCRTKRNKNQQKIDYVCPGFNGAHTHTPTSFTFFFVAVVENYVDELAAQLQTHTPVYRGVLCV